MLLLYRTSNPALLSQFVYFGFVDFGLHLIGQANIYSATFDIVIKDSFVLFIKQIVQF